MEEFPENQENSVGENTAGVEVLAQMPDYNEHMKEINKEQNSTYELATKMNDHSETLDGAEIIKKYKEELEGVDYNIQLALSQQENMLKRVSGGDEILRDVKMSIARGEYRDAYMNKRTGEILFGDEADEAMYIELHDWHSDKYDRDGFDTLKEEEKRAEYRKAIDKKTMNYISKVPYRAYACTYEYGDAMTGGSIAGGNPMSDLSERISRNLADGLYVGAKVEETYGGSTILPGVTWPKKAVNAQKAKRALDLKDSLHIDEHLFDSYNEEKAWLEENKPDVMECLKSLSQDIIDVAGNEREAGNAIDIIDGCIKDGMYRDSYIDKRGIICKNNPEELLDAEYDMENTVYKSSKEAVLEAYQKDSDSLTIDDVRAIVESPLAYKYINKIGVDTDLVFQKAITDRKLVAEYLFSKSRVGEYSFFSYGEAQRLAKEDIKNNLSEYLDECVEHKTSAGEHSPWQADVTELTEDEKFKLHSLILYSDGGRPYSAESDSEYEELVRDYERKKQIFAEHGLQMDDYERW